MNLPTLDHARSSLSAVGHPRDGTKLHRKGIPRLGRDNRKFHSTTGRISSKELLTPTAHRLSLPTSLFHPRSVHLHCHTVHRLLHLPFQGFNNRLDHEFLEFCFFYWTSSRRAHFLNTLLLKLLRQLSQGGVNQFLLCLNIFMPVKILLLFSK
jgi:hypothetical protein